MKTWQTARRFYFAPSWLAAVESCSFFQLPELTIALFSEKCKHVRGTLGLIILAKKRGIIPEVVRIIDRLIRSGMYLEKKVVDDHSGSTDLRIGLGTWFLIRIFVKESTL